MPTAKKSRITLELEAGADPIRGSIEHPDGSRQPFWGWLELIETLRRTAVTAPEHPSRSTLASTTTTPEPAAAVTRRQPPTATEE